MTGIFGIYFDPHFSRLLPFAPVLPGEWASTTFSEAIGVNDHPEDLCQGEHVLPRSVRTLVEITETAAKAGIEHALACNDHHREVTTIALGISVRTLHHKMNKYDLL